MLGFLYMHLLLVWMSLECFVWTTIVPVSFCSPWFLQYFFSCLWGREYPMVVQPSEFTVHLLGVTTERLMKNRLTVAEMLLVWCH